MNVIHSFHMPLDRRTAALGPHISNVKINNFYVEGSFAIEWIGMHKWHTVAPLNWFSFGCQFDNHVVRCLNTSHTYDARSLSRNR